MADTKFAVGETVFAYTDDLSWVIGTITSVQKNASYKPLTEAQKSSVVADSLRKKVNSKFLYTIAGSDPLMLGGSGGKGEAPTIIPDVEEWNVDVYDSSIVQAPVDDLLSLTHLHDGSILRTLAVRYMNNVVYTNIGVIVVALNPFNFKIPHYQDDKMGTYMAEKGQMIGDHLLPHSWAQAHNTYFEMCTTRANQSILISGESGAGKTEAAKIVLKYLSNVSVTDGSAEEKLKANSIAAAVTACSPILEAFGNAKTVRNDNSSRFGKLMRLKFSTKTHLLLGAYTTKYLLEKSRIITCGMDERLYHAFYLAMRAPDAATTNKFSKPHSHYKSIFAGKCVENKEFSTAEDYKEVCDAMKEMKMDDLTIRECWQIASGVVHACNSSFVSDGGEGSKIKDAESEAALKDACHLWGVKYDVVLKECTTTLVKVAGETATKLLPVHKATDVKDALCKAVYGNLFESLVEKCNVACDYMGSEDSWWIALLDIFGFENFDAPTGNSFEQLCINYANETLQQHYNWCIFTKDLEVCAAEGIDTVDIKFPDLQPTLTLVEKTLLYLDDECSLGTSDDAFIHSITSQFDKKEAAYMRHPSWRDKFAVHHFAGTVIYTVTGWLEKNRDMLKDTLKTEFTSADTNNNLSRDLFPCQARQEAAAAARTAAAGGAATKGKSKSVTLGGFFKTQMKELMDVINSTNPHWIRCVKPHPAKKPLMFGGAYTLQQLEFAGILGTVKIRKAGYPIRFPLAKFCQQFNAVKPHNSLKALVTGPAAAMAKHTATLLATMGYQAKQYAQVGKTIVFIKNDAYHLFEMARRAASLKHVCLIQRAGVGLRTRIHALRMQRAQRIQRIGRGYLCRLATLAHYVEVNKARLMEQRRIAAEVKAKQEAEEKRLREVMAALMAEHDAQRAACESGEGSNRSAIWKEEADSLAKIDAFYEELSKEVYLAKLNSMILHKLQPMAKDFEDGCRALEVREDNEFVQMLRYHHFSLMEIRISLLVIKVEEEEEMLRREIEAASERASAVIEERLASVGKKFEMLKLRNGYQQMLEAERERRKAAANERYQLNKEAERQSFAQQYGVGDLGGGPSSDLAAGNSPKDGNVLPTRYSLQKEIFGIAAQYKQIVEAEELVKQADQRREQLLDRTTGDPNFGTDLHQNNLRASARQLVATSSGMEKALSSSYISAPNGNTSVSLVSPNGSPTTRSTRATAPPIHEYLREAIPTSLYHQTLEATRNPQNRLTSSPNPPHSSIKKSMSASLFQELSRPSSPLGNAQRTFMTASAPPQSSSPYSPLAQGVHVYIPYLGRHGTIVATQVASSRRQSVGVSLYPTGISHMFPVSHSTNKDVGELVWVEADDIKVHDEEALLISEHQRPRPSLTPSPYGARSAQPHSRSPLRASSRGPSSSMNYNNKGAVGSQYTDAEIQARRRLLGLATENSATNTQRTTMESVVSTAAKHQRLDTEAIPRVHRHLDPARPASPTTQRPPQPKAVTNSSSNSWERQLQLLREYEGY